MPNLLMIARMDQAPRDEQVPSRLALHYVGSLTGDGPTELTAASMTDAMNAYETAAETRDIGDLMVKTVPI